MSADRRQAGYSLAELMVVLALLSVLGLHAHGKATQAAVDAEAERTALAAMGLREAALHYRTAQARWPDNVAELTDWLAISDVLSGGQADHYRFVKAGTTETRFFHIELPLKGIDQAANVRTRLGLQAVASPSTLTLTVFAPAAAAAFKKEGSVYALQQMKMNDHSLENLGHIRFHPKAFESGTLIVDTLRAWTVVADKIYAKHHLPYKYDPIYTVLYDFGVETGYIHTAIQDWIDWRYPNPMGGR